MNAMKRIAIYIIVILLCVSLYQDLVKNSTPVIDMSQTSTAKTSTKFKIIKHQFQPEDTVLSIVERINRHTVLPVDQIIEDFKLLNPFIDPYNLKKGGFYYFPKYE